MAMRPRAPLLEPVECKGDVDCSATDDTADDSTHDFEEALEDNSQFVDSSGSQRQHQVAFELSNAELVDCQKNEKDDTIAAQPQEDAKSKETCQLPGIMARRGLLRSHRAVEFAGSADEIEIEEADGTVQLPSSTLNKLLALATPSSCRSNHYKAVLTPRTPDPPRENFHLITGVVSAVFFDFDGTLTSTPGGAALRCNKQADLCERADFLTAHLQQLRDQQITLGVISKSSTVTVRSALEAAGLAKFFEDDLLIGKAVSLEGKAGVIEDLLGEGRIEALGLEDADRVLLVDDDVFELELASGRGMQTYAAPVEGGLQKSDFEAILAGLAA